MSDKVPCPSCHDSENPGEWSKSRNAHESGGAIPCPRCSGEQEVDPKTLSDSEREKLGFKKPEPSEENGDEKEFLTVVHTNSEFDVATVMAENKEEAEEVLSVVLLKQYDNAEGIVIDPMNIINS